MMELLILFWICIWVAVIVLAGLAKLAVTTTCTTTNIITRLYAAVTTWIRSPRTPSEKSQARDAAKRYHHRLHLIGDLPLDHVEIKTIQQEVKRSFLRDLREIIDTNDECRHPHEFDPPHNN